MSTEIISNGNDFSIKAEDRGYGGRAVEIFKVEANTGKTKVRGTDMDRVLASIFGTPKLTVAAQSSTHIDVTIQLKDAAGAPLKTAAKATIWLSDTAGAVPGSAPSGAVTFTAGTVLKEVTTKVLHEVVSTAAGLITIRIIGTAATTTYVNVAAGTKSAASTAVTFA